MNTASNRSEVPAVPASRQLYWLVRRELWENRAIWMAPLAVAGVMVAGFLLATFHLPEIAAATGAAVTTGNHLAQRYSGLAIPLVLVAMAVGTFYCLDALHGERRDRSILFWKSLPVSDLMTVLSKFSIPMLVLPVLTFIIAVAAEIVVRLLTSVLLLAHGTGIGVLWEQQALPHGCLVLLYGLIVLTLWHAPIYAWLLLVSAWAKRSTFLWAVLPPLVLSMVEKMAFDTGYIGHIIGSRLFAGLSIGFDFHHGNSVTDADVQLDPAGFFGSAGVWLGLAAAAVMLYGAMRLRRGRQPI